MLLFVFTPLLYTVSDVLAETESDFFMKRGESKGYNWNKWRERYDKRPIARVPANAVYGAKCSKCHFLYEPWLLPVRSWSAIMDNSGKHFGKALSLKEKDSKEIRSYLGKYAADKIKPRNEWTLKILRSIRGITPKSITAIPYLQKKHKRLTPDILARPAIMSISNCAACHKGAAQKGYKKRYLVIPK
jgi:hypothetical protein